MKGAALASIVRRAGRKCAWRERPYSDPAATVLAEIAPRLPERVTLAQLRAELASDGLGCPILSMGMSDDLEAAIAEGSDLVRVGTALFGPRQKTVT